MASLIMEIDNKILLKNISMLILVRLGYVKVDMYVFVEVRSAPQG